MPIRLKELRLRLRVGVSLRSLRRLGRTRVCFLLPRVPIANLVTSGLVDTTTSGTTPPDLSSCDNSWFVVGLGAQAITKTPQKVAAHPYTKVTSW
jgi:hypothetical protein